jgi:inner membrane protein
MILSPFSDRRFALDLLFIIDPLFSGILLTALIFSYLWKRRATSICSLSLVFVTLYVGLCGICHHKALTLAERFARESGVIHQEIASLPQPTSPFKWVNLIETDEVVYQGYLDLLRKPGQNRKSYSNPFFQRFFSSYYSPSEIRYRAFEERQSSPWIERALALDDVRFFYRFARFPIASYRRVGDRHVVQFMDLRFSAPGIRNPFRYVVEFSEEGKLIKHELE